MTTKTLDISPELQALIAEVNKSRNELYAQANSPEELAFYKHLTRRVLNGESRSEIMAGAEERLFEILCNASPASTH